MKLGFLFFFFRDEIALKSSPSLLNPPKNTKANTAGFISAAQRQTGSAFGGSGGAHTSGV